MIRYKNTPRSLRKLPLTLVAIIIAAAFFLSSHRVEATNKFWIASSPGNFNVDANWSLTSGGPPNTTAPNASDVAFFDGNGLGNCTIAVNANVEGINIGSGYSGAITVASGVAVTVGSTGFSQSGGTFNGGNSDIDINGEFLLRGTGVFNSTTGTLFLGSTFDHNTSSNPGGTFNHNNGTVTFDGNGGGINSELSGTVFNNVNFSHNDLSQRIVFNTSGGGPTMTVLGALAFNDGQLFGSRIEARGAVTIAPNFDGAPVNHATLVIANGTGPRTITFAAGTNMLNVILNDANATIQTSGSGALNWRSLVLEAGTINQGGVDFVFPPGGLGVYTQSGGAFNGGGNQIAFGSAFTQSGGAFNGGSGDIDVDGDFTISGGAFTSTTGTLSLSKAYTHDAGGTFNHNNGTVVCDGSSAGITISLPVAGETFNNLTFNLPGGQRSISGGRTMITLGTLSLIDGNLFGGTLQPQGNMTIVSTFDGASGTAVTFSGANDQTFTNNGGATPTGAWSVNKSARAVTLASDLMLQAGQQLNITSGVLDQGASFNLTAGPITVGAAGRLQNRGTGDLTLRGDVSNSGFINFNGGGITNCGDPDSILIRSSVDGAQRHWSGGGSFSMIDVDVKDQIADNPPVVTALNSTDSGNNTNWNFDPSCGPTEVTLESFTATGFEDGAVLLEWRTGFESDNLGFNIYRDVAGKRTLVNSQLVAGSALTAGSTLLAGRSYDLRDNFTDKGASYWLEEIDLDQGSTWHGPYFVKMVGGKPPASPRAAFLSEIGKRVTNIAHATPVEMRASEAHLSSKQLAESADLAAKPAVKIAIQREAWYRITQPELVAAGLDPTIDPRLLQLIADGRQQRIQVSGENDGRFDPQDAVEFYAVGLDSPFTDARTYWLIAGHQAGLRVRRVRADAAPSADQSFTHTIERRDRSIYFSSLRNGERENFFGQVITQSAVDLSLTLTHLAQPGSGDALLEVALQGVTFAPHRVSVEVNEHMAGEIVFDAQSQGTAKFRLSHSMLGEGANRVRLTATAGATDISLVDYVRISYQHAFVADNDSIKFNANGNQSITVGGFMSGSVRVLDVTDPDSPQELVCDITDQKAGYSVRFASPEAGQRAFLAFTAEQTPAGVSANCPSDLRKANADFIIITRREFADSFRPLVSLRHSQGLSVALVDIEDIYDEFSFGQKSPQAVRDFLSHAKSNWKKKPRFLLFAADASLDPKNYLGFGRFDLVPTRLVDTGFMETASDDWFSDFDSNGIAEIATGRLPARTADEAASLVSKIIDYERSAAAEELLLISDVNDGFNFEATIDELMALIPAGVRVTRIRRGQLDDETARANLLDALSREQRIVNYIGHGSVDLWRGGLLTAADGEALKNDGFPLFVSLTCLNGYFHDAGTESLAESWMKAERGGAIAAWASSGMALPAEQSKMNRELYRLLFGQVKALRLGEAVMRAKMKAADVDIRRTWILFGDPTLKFK